MTREVQRVEFANSQVDCEFFNEDLYAGIIIGAKWADEHPEPEMVNKAEFIAKVKRWLELETDWNMEYDEEGRNDNYGKIDELVKYLEN